MNELVNQLTHTTIDSDTCIPVSIRVFTGEVIKITKPNKIPFLNEMIDACDSYTHDAPPIPITNPRITYDGLSCLSELVDYAETDTRNINEFLQDLSPHTVWSIIEAADLLGPKYIKTLAIQQEANRTREYSIAEWSRYWGVTKAETTVVGKRKRTRKDEHSDDDDFIS